MSNQVSIGVEDENIIVRAGDSRAYDNYGYASISVATARELIVDLEDVIKIVVKVAKANREEKIAKLKHELACLEGGDVIY